MEDQVYHAKVIRVSKEGSVWVMPTAYTRDSYRDTMVLHTSHTNMYDRFGDPVEVGFFKKNQWVKFVTNGVMTMSLPPQLNPMVLHEQMPIIEFVAEIKAINHKFELHVVDSLGSFIEGDITMGFFDEPVIFNQNQEKIKLDSLKPTDKVMVYAVASFITKEPLIEITRLELV